MLPEIRVDGARQLSQVSRALKGASPALRRELAKGIREGTEPVKQAAMDNIEPTIPSSGGLAGLVRQDTRVVTQRRGGGASPGVRLRAQSRRNVRRMDRGRVRKPLFGNTDHWFTQSIKPGWFTTPVLQAAPALRKVLMEHLDNVARKIARGM